MSKVWVIILSDGGDPEKVKRYFDSDTFDVHVLSSPSIPINVIPSMRKADENEGVSNISPREDRLMKAMIYSNHLFHSALTMMEDDNPGIIIRDTSICGFDKDKIKALVKKIQSSSNNNHLVYLGRWQDQCYLHRNSEALLDEFNIVSTYGPRGFQAIYVSKFARDMIKLREYEWEYVKSDTFMSDLVRDDIIKAKAVIPNIFTYNYTDYAESDTDYDKTIECINLATVEREKKSNTENYIAIAGIITITLVVGWAAFSLGPKGKGEDGED